MKCSSSLPPITTDRTRRNTCRLSIFLGRLALDVILSAASCLEGFAVRIVAEIGAFLAVGLLVALVISGISGGSQEAAGMVHEVRLAGPVEEETTNFLE